MNIDEWRITVAKRPWHLELPVPDVDLTAVMGRKHASARFAMTLPIFSWEQHMREDKWGFAQFLGYLRVLPYHILSLYKNSDFADADINLYVAVSEPLWPHAQSYLKALNFPADRVLRFPEGDESQFPFCWSYKCIAMFQPHLDSYDGVIHSDVSNFVAPGPDGERLELFEYIVDGWDTHFEDFLVLDNLPAPEHAWCTFNRAMALCIKRLGITAKKMWTELSKVTQIPPAEMSAAWQKMWEDGTYPDVRGPIYGIAQGLRTNVRFRSEILTLMSLIPFDDGALAFYLWWNGLEQDDVFTLDGRVMHPHQPAQNILAGAPWVKPDYLYAYYQAHQELPPFKRELWDALCEGVR